LDETAPQLFHPVNMDGELLQNFQAINVGNGSLDARSVG